MSFLIVANWKMNGSTEMAKQFKESLEAYPAGHNDELVICPPFVYLSLLRSHKYRLGAQDVSKFDEGGAHTGEVSAAMLVDSGCSYVIIGHSERRGSEDNDIIRAKIMAAQKQGLKVILCVGESEEERSCGRYLDSIDRQLNNLAGVDFQELLVAYEPLWAIGTGKVANAGQLVEVADFVMSKYLSVSLAESGSCGILYGGSVSSESAIELSRLKQIKGLLIGASSLECTRLIDILNAIC